MQEQHKAFHLLYQEHLKAGTRAGQSADDPRREKWKHEEFAAAVRCEARTVTNWKNRSRTPLKPEFDRIVALLFGNNPLHTEARAELIAAWEAADRKRVPPGRRGTPPAARSNQHLPEWAPETPFVLRYDLGRLYVHRSNDGEPLPGSTVLLEITAETGRTEVRVPETADTPRIDDVFVVTKAQIVVVAELNVTPVPTSNIRT